MKLDNEDKNGSSLNCRFSLMISQDDLMAVEDWCFANRVMSKSKGIRNLIRKGLTAEEANQAASAT